LGRRTILYFYELLRSGKDELALFLLSVNRGSVRSLLLEIASIFFKETGMHSFITETDSCELKTWFNLSQTHYAVMAKTALT